MIFQAINWNAPDQLDLTVWEKLNGQIWFPGEFVIDNDKKSWRTLSKDEQWLFLRVLAGLTVLDTLQAEFGAPSLEVDATSKHEKAIYKNIGYMEEIHAESYSYTFQSLVGTEEIERVFRWAAENEYIQKKAGIVYEYYQGEDPHKKKIASVLLESFLFYSGFYLPLHLNGHEKKMTNTADLIRTIMKDEAIHGFYIGKKFEQNFGVLEEQEKQSLKYWAADLLTDLYINEVKYTQSLYDDFGLTEEVKKFLRYNANMAFQNLGFDDPFPYEEIDPVIENQLNTKGVTKDIFSGKANYAKPRKNIEMSDDDFADFDF